MTGVTVGTSLTRLLEVHRLGVTAYAHGLEWQRAAAAAVRAGEPERVALLEHRPVYTLGARGGRASLRVTPEALPAPLVETDRGGDVTFHGPGQTVAYLVLNLRARELRPGDYVRALESAVITALAALGIEGERWSGRPGVWVRLEQGDGELAKVAAIGVRVRDGVTQHGLALNVNVDPRWFAPIVPCGIGDAGVTSLGDVLGEVPAMRAVEAALLDGFVSVFACTPVEAREPVYA
jgi:lipoyl(octanoyl) transferase